MSAISQTDTKLSFDTHHCMCDCLHWECIQCYKSKCSFQWCCCIIDYNYLSQGHIHLYLNSINNKCQSKHRCSTYHCMCDCLREECIQCYKSKCSFQWCYCIIDYNHLSQQHTHWYLNVKRCQQYDRLMQNVALILTIACTIVYIENVSIVTRANVTSNGVVA